ncbi:MAG TPA: zinc-binding alcohol dehydrogenase [Chloroflexota bacterium]|jgi:threonine dehydrogenase-like Zn-dependent dehydrogenase
MATRWRDIAPAARSARGLAPGRAGVSARGHRLLVGGGAVELAEHEWPDPGPGQILVRVARSQVSAGSEMNAHRAAAASGGEPRPTGYTTVGRVELVGPDVERFRPGDRVLAFGNHASHCLVDLTAPDAWRSYPEAVPDEVTDEQACFAVLGDVALHGVRRAGLQIDESVAVFGAGVVGQLTLQFARLSGAHPIIAIDLVGRRLEMARAHGATHTVDAGREDAAAAVRAMTGGVGAQTVFHCTPVARILQTTMEAAADRGKVVLTGSAPGTAEIGLQVELLRHELSIIGVYESGLEQPHAYWPWSRSRNRRACFRLIASGELTVDDMISHVVPPTRADEMYRLLAAGAGDWMSVIFAWD